jgi:hypothetical protein
VKAFKQQYCSPLPGWLISTSVHREIKENLSTANMRRRAGRACVACQAMCLLRRRRVVEIRRLWTLVALQ